MSDRYDKKKIIIFDLDGTLADCEHRRHLVNGEKKDFDAFYLACHDDVPMPATIAIWDHLRVSQQYALWIVSGRSDIAWDKTLVWLAENGIKPDSLYMRKQGDYTPDADLKWQWMEQYKDRILLAFDDRDRIVRMWRSHGIPCFQVAEGNF